LVHVTQAGKNVKKKSTGNVGVVVRNDLIHQKIIRENGKLYATYLVATLNQNPMQQIYPEFAIVIITLNQFHSVVKYPNNEVIKEAAKSHNIQLTDVHQKLVSTVPKQRLG
jgi:hypothetical protein